MADRFDFTPPNWVKQEEDGSQTVMVWDSATHTYVARGDKGELSSPGHGDSKPVPDTSHAGGGDNYQFDPAEMNEQVGNPMFEGWMAHTGSTDFGKYVQDHEGDVAGAQQQLFEDLQQQGMNRDAAWQASLEYQHNWESWNPTHHQLETYPERYQPGAEPHTFGEAPQHTDMSGFEDALPSDEQSVPPCPHCRSNALRPSASDGGNDYYECGICHHEFVEDAGDPGQLHDTSADEQGMENYFPDMSDLESIPTTEHPLGPHTGSVVCPQCQQPGEIGQGRCLHCGHAFDNSAEDKNKAMLNDTDTDPFFDVVPKDDFAHMPGTGVPAALGHWADSNPMAEMQQRPEDMIGQQVTLDGVPATINGHGSGTMGEVRDKDGIYIPASWVYIDKRLREHGGQFVSKVAAEPSPTLGTPPQPGANFDFDDMFRPGIVGGKQETHRFILDPAHNMYIAPATMDHKQIVDQNGIQEFARGSVYGDGTAEVNLQRMPGQIDRQGLATQLQQHVGGPVNVTYMPGDEGQSQQETGGSFVVHGTAATEQTGGGFAWRKESGVPSQELTDSASLVFVAEHAETTDYPIYSRCKGGFITATGGTTSHAAVVARQAGQPCLVGVGADYSKIGQGASVRIDGRGSAQVGPPNAKVQEYMQRGDQEWSNAMERRQEMQKRIPEWQLPNRGGSVSDNRPEDKPYEIVDGNFVAVSATLDECPECTSPMVERENQKLCHSCGHKQQIMYASTKESLDLNPIDLAGKGVDFAQEHPWETAALVGGAALAPWAVPEIAGAAGLMGAGEAGAAAAGEVGATTAGEAAAEQAGVGGVRGALSKGLSGAGKAGQAGMGIQGVQQGAGMLEGAAGMNVPQGPDESGMQAQLAKVRASSAEGMWEFDFDPRLAADDDDESVDTVEDDEEEHEPQECPMCGGPGSLLGSLGKRKHYRCRDCGNDFSHQHRESKTGDELEVGGARDDGDDVTEEGTQGARLDHGDETGGESLRDTTADGGSANSYDPAQSEALEAFQHAQSDPEISIFLNSDEHSGRGHEGFEALIDQLAKAFPGAFDDLLPGGEEHGHEEHDEGEEHEPKHTGDDSASSSGSDGSDAKLGGNMDTTAGIPGWSGAPDAGGEGGADGIAGWSGAPNTSAPAEGGMYDGEGGEFSSQCHGCRSPLQGHEKFCPECGTPQGGGDEPQQTPPPEMPLEHHRNLPWQERQDPKQASPHRAPNDAARQHAPADHPWVTADGTHLEAGKRYLMKPNGYSVPDDITVDQVTSSEIRFTVHGAGMDFPDKMDRQEFDNQGGFSFELKDAAPEDTVQEVDQREKMPAPNQGQDAGSADPAQKTDLADLPTPVSSEQEVGDSMFDSIPDEHIESGDDGLIYRDPTTGEEMNYQQYAAHLAAEAPEGMKWLWEDKNPNADTEISDRMKSMMMATAGRNFTPQQQKEFIQEQGEARNLSKLQLEGTHYTEHDGSSVNPDECWF